MPPPPPPPPGPGPPPPPPMSGGGIKTGGTPNRSALLDQIHHGARLKKAVTNDRSAPQLTAVKSPGGDQGSRGGGGNIGGGVGQLFSGGMPKLKSAGQSARGPGVGGMALKPPGSMSNGPSDGGRMTNGGPPPPPPSTNRPPANKSAPPAPPPSAGKPRNAGGLPPPPVPGSNKPSIGGAPGRINSDAFRKFNTSTDEVDNSSDPPRPHASSLAGGLASRNHQNQSSVPKPHLPFGTPASSPIPPPPPSRPPPSNPSRPNSMVGRPLPPPPPPCGDNEPVVGPGRTPPPPPSRSVAPPPPPNRGNAPTPPNRASNKVVVGTVGRSGLPNMRPETPRRGSIGSVVPTRPQIQAPTGARNKLLESSSSGGEDFESRFRFHPELPHPEPFSNINKIYPSENPRNSGRRPPPPQPPR